MDKNAKSLLVVIVPVALVMTMMDSVWPLFIPAIAFCISWQLWQKYKWQQLLNAANPEFQRLIETNQGKVTVADLTLATGMSGNSAQWFLSRKAKEYGAQIIDSQNLGVVYHFLTAGALDNMFDKSTPEAQMNNLSHN